MDFLGVILGLGFGILFIYYALLNWNEMRYNRKKKGLPPGTMGWPVIGETTKFLKQGPDFLKNQRARYGALFKSHILGSPTVVCMDPELSRHILMNEGKGFVPGYPQSMMDIMGKSNIAAVTGSLHKTMRASILGLLGASMIKGQLLPKIDQFVRSHLSNLSHEIIDIQQKTKEMAFLLMLKQAASTETSPFAEAIKAELFRLVLGTFSLPINLPGTNYHRALKARKKIICMLTEIIEERRASSSLHHDMLDCLLQPEEGSKAKLTNDQIIDVIIALIYSSYETVSTTSMMAVKYLHDHPKILEDLRNEHLEIRKGKLPGDALSSNDYKSMNFTRAVILETLRMASVVKGVLRKTTEDIEIRGFVIPTGWKIILYMGEMNYDPRLYPEPLTFNPRRWMIQDENLEAHQLFFGGGSRLCLGKELGIIEISTFLHYFVTRYRWEEVGGDTMLQSPRVEAPNGLHIRVWDY